MMLYKTSLTRTADRVHNFYYYKVGFFFFEAAKYTTKYILRYFMTKESLDNQ
jgi:hypothetical protein